MDEKIVLYSTGCPQCNVLKKKLDSAGIEYTEVDDKQAILDAGITTVPVLQVGNTRFESLKEANDWIKERAGNTK